MSSFVGLTVRPVLLCGDEVDSLPVEEALRKSMTLIPDGDIVVDGVRREVRLLVIDDHSDHFEQIEAFASMECSRFSFECKLAHSPEEVPAIAQSWSPSVVLVDVHLAAKAFELIRTLAQAGAAVVALSEARIPELEETVQSYGAVGYFTKSDNPEDVEALLNFAASFSGSSFVSH